MVDLVTNSPATEVVSRIAVNILTELIKSTVKGLKKADKRAREKTREHDPFRIAARKYAEGLERRYSSIRIIGMNEPVELRRVYVRVNILEDITASRQISVEKLEEDFDRDRRGFGVVKSTTNALDVVNSLERVLVLGKPGAGKTTFLKFITLQALDGNLSRERIPIFISLKDWSDSGISLFEHIVKQFEICGLPEARYFVDRLINKGKCILLLDGFDEVTGKVDHAIQEIRDFSEQYHKNHFILSCRIAAYNYVFEQFTEVEMADFNDAQIHTFVNNWFGNDSHKATICWAKLNESENKPIKELTSIPLLLAMLCIAFDSTMDFPDNRADLYKESIDVLLKKWDASRAIKRDMVYKQLSVKRKENMLSTIAYRTFQRNQYFFRQIILERYIASFISNLVDVNESSNEIDCGVILKSIEAQHGLLIERAKSIYSFSHLTFQEYFVAKYIVDNSLYGLPDHPLEKNLFNEQWREVLLLAVSMLGNSDRLFISLRSLLTKFGQSDEKIVELLKSIPNVVQKDKPLSRFFAIFDMAHRLTERSKNQEISDAAQLVKSIARKMSMELDYSADMGKMRDSMLYREKCSDLSRALMRGSSNERLVEFLRNLKKYLLGTRILSECLITDSYINRSLRSSLGEYILREPWNYDQSQLTNDFLEDLPDDLKEEAAEDQVCEDQASKEEIRPSWMSEVIHSTPMSRRSFIELNTPRISNPLVGLRELAYTPKPMRESTRIVRNYPCFCGSGKKYEECCMLKLP